MNESKWFLARVKFPNTAAPLLVAFEASCVEEAVGLCGRRYPADYLGMSVYGGSVENAVASTPMTEGDLASLGIDGAYRFSKPKPDPASEPASEPLVLKTAYFTFGQGHRHEFNGHTLDHNTVMRVTSPDPWNTMRHYFKDKWCTDYAELPDPKYGYKWVYCFTPDLLIPYASAPNIKF